ncbi:MAG: CheR family methyltransferase [Hyphomonadaceae bacterium]
MSKRPTFVIGLGASAGGLEALEKFFDNAPVDSGGAFVVVMHLSRDFNSMLDELLARHTSMKVQPVVDRAELEADTVYVIQPATTIELQGASFRVTTRPLVDPQGPISTIDTLFRSIATQWRERAAAVVLSGSGSDGSRGVIEVQKAGGFACAQAPETAKFDSMPVAAIATRSVRAVEAPEHLAQIAIEGILVPGLNAGRHFVTDHDGALARILEAVVGVSTLDATKYKHSTFERRVRRRMMDLQIGSMTAYADRVVDDPIEARRLADALLIGVTSFFRDTDAFNIMSQQVIPEIIRRAQLEDRSIRIWVPGCATGEEPYSIAMLFAEAMKDLPQKLDVQIFASDVKRDFLSEAARGEFAEARLEGVPPDMREQFFKPINGGGYYVIDPAIRKMIVFAPHDILTDPPFTRLDMVSCRNLLIYLSVEAQQRILGGFAFGLLEKGCLFLGSSETVGGFRETFEYIDARNRIFRRTANNRNNMIWRASERMLSESNSLGAPKRTIKMREAALQPAYSALLKEYAPPCLLLSSDRELLHSFGDARKYIRAPEGVINLDTANMVDPALKTPIIAGLERALRDKKPMTFSRITLEEFPEKGKVVDLTVRPLLLDPDGEVLHALVSVDSANRNTADLRSNDALTVSAEALANVRIQELETELARTRESLQATIEEIETTNEELQATNEELMSSNEELQSTNEELSSVNEELYTVNSEFHKQNLELTKLSSDFELLLESTEVGVIFLDRELKITRFTTLAGELFQLADADLGRPISTFRSPFDGLEPEKLLQSALQTDTVIEAEAVDGEGHAWLARAVTHSNNLGAVLTLINIARLRDAEASARRATSMLEAIRKGSHAFYLETGSAADELRSQLGWDEFVGAEDLDGPREIDWSKIHPDDVETFKEALAKSQQSGLLQTIVRIWNAATGDHRYVRLSGTFAMDTLRIIGSDVDDIVRRERESTEAAAILEAMLQASTALVSFVDANKRYRYVNDAYVRQWKIDKTDIIGKTVHEYLPEGSYIDAEPHIEAALRGQRQEFTIEVDGPEQPARVFSVVYQPVTEDDGSVIGFVVDKLDVSKFYALADAFNNTDRLIAKGVRQSVDATVLADIDTSNVVFANRRANARHQRMRHARRRPASQLQTLEQQGRPCRSVEH